MAKSPGLFAPDGSLYITLTDGLGHALQSSLKQPGSISKDGSLYVLQTSGAGNLI